MSDSDDTEKAGNTTASNDTSKTGDDTKTKEVSKTKGDTETKAVPTAATASKTKGTLLVVDGHSLAFRAYFALPVESFTTSTGQPTNAVWGFSTMLAQVLDNEKPDHLAVAFDMAGGTFRNKMLPQYKGTRDAAPEELLSQLPIIQDLLKALGVRYVEKKGYEGDDIIGTMASMGEDAGYKTLVLSGDRDAFQLIDDDITVLYPGHHFKDLKHMTPQAIVDKYKVTPQQYPDLAAMRGETADNIPGVPGVGDGYAAKWINQYGGLEGIIEHADELPGKKGQALRDNIEQVKLNRRVNAVLRDMDLGASIDDFTLGGMDIDKVNAIFAKLQFSNRSKNRLVKSFNGGVMPDVANVTEDSTPAEDDQLSIKEPNITEIADAGELGDWINKNMGPEFVADISGISDHVLEVFGAEGDAATAKAGKAAGADKADNAGNTGKSSEADGPAEAGSSKSDSDERSDEQAIIEGAKGPELVDHDMKCSEQVGHSWVLYAAGRSKPGNARLETVVMLVGDEAAVIAASAIDDVMRDELQTLLGAYHRSMVVHGYKEHLHLLASVGIALARPLFDTKLAGYLVHPDFHADTLAKAAEHFLKLEIPESKPKKAQGELDFGEDDDAASNAEESKEAQQEAVKDAAIVRALADFLKTPIDQRKQFGLLRSIELPVSQVLYDIEDAGAKVDLGRLHELLDGFTADADQAQQIAFEAAGHELNLQSPKQLQTVLFDEMGLKPSRKTKSGSYTTNAATLQNLYVKYAEDEKASNFLGALLRHRETNKLKQIAQTLLEAVNARDGRIHTTFEQTVAATGRLSSVDPNLQNIPNRNATGREIRSAFVPGEGFESLLSCDYSQVELRIMADLSGDESLIEAFKSGADFHRYVASLVYDIPMDEISSDQRSHVKAMSYGLAYGLSTYGLSQQLKISPAEADVLKNKYFATFGKVHDYLESLVATARQKGYTETMFGRRRYFPGLKSSRRQVRDAAERGALNAPIQGSAADIMKIAMIRADHALRESGVKSRVILQIHDELVLEVAPGESEQVSELVRDAMEHAVDLAVPLDVSIGIGSDWQAAAH
ncbi:DNA polymerase I [Bifidobacterium sp. ESL0800]|uniref:DNA polymerase I n=1 Tax=Bifidobacterium sp. ESL0800 TaxID=2983236 RepID=UPI0023FA0E26|nr:DNA polymerase I [Bifidobacterium sp. ESL0800]WEV76001.1 DNA polymerase I [Bifidobacterium sp. ESL0800]